MDRDVFKGSIIMKSIFGGRMYQNENGDQQLEDVIHAPQQSNMILKMNKPMHIETNNIQMHTKLKNPK